MSGQYWKWIPSPTTHAGIWVTTSLYHHLQNILLINLKKRQRQRQRQEYAVNVSYRTIFGRVSSNFAIAYVALPTYNKSTWLSRCTFYTLKWVISRSSSSLPPPKPWYEDPQHAGKLETTWSRHLPTANFNLMSLSSSTWPPRGIQAGQTSWWRKSCLVTKIRILWNAHFLSF